MKNGINLDHLNYYVSMIDYVDYLFFYSFYSNNTDGPAMDVQS